MSADQSDSRIMEERDAAYRQRDRYALALRLAVGDEQVGEWLAQADAARKAAFDEDGAR